MMIVEQVLQKPTLINVNRFILQVIILSNITVLSVSDHVDAPIIVVAYKSNKKGRVSNNQQY